MQGRTLQLQQRRPFMHGLLQVRGRVACCSRFNSKQMDIEDDEGELGVDDYDEEY